MPKYRMPTGVVVEVSDKQAALIGGLTPIEPPSAPPRGAAKKERFASKRAPD